MKFILVDTFHGQMSTPFICPLVTMRPGVSDDLESALNVVEIILKMWDLGKGRNKMRTL